MKQQPYSTKMLEKQLSAVFDKYCPKLVYFFGSAIRSEIGPLSDIDLAVLWPEEVNVPMLKSLELQAAVKDKLQDERFEIGCLNGQNLSFCYTVICTGACIYGKKEDRVNYETKILSQYLDFNYLAEQYNRGFDEDVLRKSHGQP